MDLAPSAKCFLVRPNITRTICSHFKKPPFWTPGNNIISRSHSDIRHAVEHDFEIFIAVLRGVLERPKIDDENDCMKKVRTVSQTA